MSKETKKTMDMVNGPLLKNIMIFSIPLMISNLLQIAFNAADTIIVGKFASQEALAAVGATGSIINLVVCLFVGLSTGANIVIARQIGRGQKDLISDSVHTSYFLAFSGGILLTVLGYLCTPFLLKVIQTPDNILQLSQTYMRIYFLGSIPLLVYDFGSAVMRSTGDTTKPTIYLMLGGILNVILNLYFVIILQMSVKGVAYATVISQAVSAILVTISLMRENDDTKLIISRIRANKELTKNIFRIGIPAGMQSMMWAISNVVIQAELNKFGSVVVAGNSAAANIENFVYIGMGAFSQATITFTSQNAGAGRKDNIKKLMIVLSILIFLASITIGTIAWYYGEFFLSFYTNDQAVIDAGMVRMFYIVLFLFLNGILDVPASSMRGMGKSTLPTLVMLIGIVVVRIVYVYTVYPFFHTLPALYFCFPLSWVITLVLMYFFWIIEYKKY